MPFGRRVSSSSASRRSHAKRKRSGAVAATVVAASCAAFAGLTPSCGGSSDTSADAGAADTAAQVTCMSDPRRDEFVANLTKHGKNNLFQFVLVTVDPTPPALDTNVWTVKVLDPTGNVVPDVTVTVGKPYMPLHLHSSSQTPQIAPATAGAFTVGNLNFFMVGLFQVTITATAHGQTDSADFFFCVQ